MSVAFHAWLDERITLYDLLRRLYREPPSREVLAFVERLEVQPDAPPALGHGLARMQSAARTPRAAEALGEEFTRLFLGPGEVLVPPFASCYLADEGLVMQEATVQARLAYARADLVVERLYSEPDDHIAVEWEFLYALAVRAAGALARDDDRDAPQWLAWHDDFLTAHVLRWMPRLCQRLIDATSNPFFIGLALVTEGILNADACPGAECS